MSKRLFLAIPIRPDEILIQQKLFLINNLKEERINWVKDENMHLTLKFIGKTPTKKIPELIEAVNACIKTKPFQLTLENIGIFGSAYQAKVIWIGVQQNNDLLNLYTQIAKQLEQIGYEIGRQNFVPHFTLGRINRIIHKDHFKKVMGNSEKGFIQKINVEKIILFESILKPEGPVYNVIKSFILSEQ